MSELVVVLVSSRQAGGGSVDSGPLSSIGEDEVSRGGVISQDMWSFPIQLCMSVIDQSMRGKKIISRKDLKPQITITKGLLHSALV